MELNDLKGKLSLKDRYLFIFVFILSCFIAYKIPYLSLPYFWDEAWSYIPAINDLSRHGLSMMPDALNPVNSRGHPLFFYFFAAGWTKIFGSSTLSLHCFALTISSMLLWLIYFAGRKVFNPVTAIMAVIFLCLQSVFLAQSTFVLPEVLLAFWTILCIYLFISGKYLWFVAAGTLMLLTKETGIVILFAIGAWTTFKNIVSKKIFSFHYIKMAFLVFLPVILASTHFFIQKYTFGWFFFPEHIGMMHFENEVIKDKLRYCYYILFVQQGRNIFSFFLVAGGLYLLFKKRNGSVRETHDLQKNFIGISIFCVICMFGFSAINFFTYRYLICLLPLYVILGSYVITQTFSFTDKLSWIVYLIPLIFFIRFDLGIYPPSDSTLSYIPSIRIQKDVTLFAEQNNLYKKKIYVSFLYSFCLGVEETKYRSTPVRFTGLNNSLSCDNDYLIHSNIEEDPKFSELKRACNLLLIKRFDREGIWAEIYKVER